MSSSSVDEDEWDDFASFPTNAQETPVHINNNSSEVTISDEDWHEFDLSSPLSNGHTINNRSIEHIEPSHRDSNIEICQFNSQPLDSYEMNEVGHGDASQVERTEIYVQQDNHTIRTNITENIDLAPPLSMFSTDSQMATEPNHEVQTVITHRASLIDREHNDNNGQTLPLSNSIPTVSGPQDISSTHPMITNPNQTSSHILTPDHSESPATVASPPLVEDNTQTTNTLPIPSHTQYSSQSDHTDVSVIECDDTPGQAKDNTHVPIIVQESELRPPERPDTEQGHVELDEGALANTTPSTEQAINATINELATAVVRETADDIEPSLVGGQATGTLLDTADTSVTIRTPHSSSMKQQEEEEEEVVVGEVKSTYGEPLTHTEQCPPTAPAAIDTSSLDQSQNLELTSSHPVDPAVPQNGSDHLTYTTPDNNGNTEGGDDDFETSPSTLFTDTTPTLTTAPPPVSSPLVPAEANEAGIKGEGEDSNNHTNMQVQDSLSASPVDTSTTHNDTAQIDDEEEEEDDWQAFESSPPPLPLPDMSTPILTKEFNDGHISYITHTDIEQQSFEISSSSQLQPTDTHIITHNNTNTSEVEEEEDDDDWQAFESNTLSEPAPTPASAPTFATVPIPTPVPVPVYSTPSSESAPPTTSKQPTPNKASLTCNILEANVSIVTCI